MSHTENKSGSPRFRVGDKVQVKSGVIDPDFSDIPLGGWSGTVKEVEQADDEITYDIKWNKKTLGGMHPIYRKRCERDGLEIETMWLGEEDIEPDDGTPVSMEQPTSIVTKPLSEKDQDDRVRMALGLTHDDPLPEVSRKTLLAYYRYLAANLKFPFFISYWAKSGPFSSKKVIVPISRLDPPVEDEFDEEAGLYGIGVDQDEEIEIPLAEIELKKKEANYRLISDYSYWFHNWW
jgi:calcium binding protein